MAAKSLCVWYGLAALLRAAVVRLCAADWDTIEVATVANSRRRLLECVHVWRTGGGSALYAGSLCHEQPVFVALTDALLRLFGAGALPVLGAALDLAAALCIGAVAREYVVFMAARCKAGLPAAPAGDSGTGDDFDRWQFARSLPTVDRADGAAVLCALCYLFNPAAVLAAATYSGACVDNALVALAALMAVKGRPLPSLMSLALLAYRTLHPAVLLLPIVLLLCNRRQDSDAKSAGDGPAFAWRRAAACVAAFVLMCSALVAVSCGIMRQHWREYLHSTYGFLLTAPDHTPNMGLFWYFFIEMFEHFRSLFLCAFQANLLVYLAPLALLLHSDGYMVLLVECLMLAAFKPYPSVADVAIPLALLPACRHYFALLRHTLVIACMALAALALAPVTWHLWIDKQSANANFYFATTLLYNTAIVLLLTDLLYAHRLFELFVSFGRRPKVAGKRCIVQLQRVLDAQSLVIKAKGDQGTRAQRVKAALLAALHRVRAAMRFGRAAE